LYRDGIAGDSRGIGINNLRAGDIESLMIPLPPLAEQRRIVAKVDELMGLLDELERTRDEREARRAAFRDSALAALQNAEDAQAARDAWTRIATNLADCLTDPADIAPLRQTILQLAVRGRLVPQDPTDEPASSLLEKIRNEKKCLVDKGDIRQPKPLSPIDLDQCPYTPPSGWMWIRLGEITLIRTGKLDANASSHDGQYPFFTCSKNPLRISHFAYDCECVLLAGNGNFDVNYYDGKFEAYQRTYIIEPPLRGVFSVRFLYLFMQLYSSELLKQSIGGVIRYIKIGFLTEAPFPLPPFAEQRRIVAKVDELMAVCDELEKQLTEAKAHQSAFAAAAVHHLEV
jgi:type I restriction enzyme S subunit